MARHKTLPLYDPLTLVNSDPMKPVKSDLLFLLLKLRDLHPDTPPDDRLKSQVAYVEQLLAYFGFTRPAELDPFPWRRLEQLAACVPVRYVPRDQLAPGGFAWAKARALLDAAIDLDRPRPRGELKGSDTVTRTMYHAHAFGGPIYPLVDLPLETARAHLQGAMYRRLLYALRLGDDTESQAGAREGYRVTSVGDDRPFGSYVRRSNGARRAQEIIPIGVAVRSPEGAAELLSDEDRARLRAQVDDLRTVAGPTASQFIENEVQRGPADRVTRWTTAERAARNEQWLSEHPTDENRWALKAGRARLLRAGSVSEPLRADLLPMGDKPLAGCWAIRPIGVCTLSRNHTGHHRLSSRTYGLRPRCETAACTRASGHAGPHMDIGAPFVWICGDRKSYARHGWLWGRSPRLFWRRPEGLDPWLRMFRHEQEQALSKIWEGRPLTEWTYPSEAVAGRLRQLLSDLRDRARVFPWVLSLEARPDPNNGEGYWWANPNLTTPCIYK